MLLNAIQFNSDEPQHAHVAWAWGAGLAPYRDVFDNHVPLFHMLFGPIVRSLGETPDILLWLRLAIVPISVMALGLAYWIGRSLWNRQVGMWTVLLVFACPPYLYIAGQFRTDVLWGTAWVGVIAVAVLGRWSHWRAFAVGLGIGVAFAVSLKTTLLVAGLGLAWGMVHVATPAGSRPRNSALGISALSILLGSLVVPVLVIAVVAAKGGLDAMRYDVLQHNLVHGLGQSGYSAHRLVVICGLGALLGRLLFQQSRAAFTPLHGRRTLVVASVLVYGLLLFGTWPLLARQDILPAVPLLAIGLAGWWNGAASRHGTWLPPVLASLGLAAVFFQHVPWQDSTARYRDTLANVLAITSPRDDVLDDKGAAIYRTRPFYYALETITLQRLRRGLIQDDITQRVLDTDTHVVWAERLPAKDLRFVTQHYLPLDGGLRIAGFALGALRAGAVRPIQVLLPGAYSLIAGGHPANGRFDNGTDMATKQLGAGLHMLQVPRAGNYLLVWRPAAPLFEKATRP